MGGENWSWFKSHGVTGSMEERGHCEKLKFAKRFHGEEKEEKAWVKSTNMSAGAPQNKGGKGGSGKGRSEKEKASKQH